MWNTLPLLFKSELEEGTFPEDWKKSNVVPIHKKNVQKFNKKLLTHHFPYLRKFLEDYYLKYI